MGQGAEAFAAEKGLEIVDSSYFYMQFRWNQLQKAIAQERLLQDYEAITDLPQPDANEKTDEKRGTWEQRPRIAKATSPRGITNKRFGRVGDSPIIGAETCADNRSVAVSATGTGEIFIRTVAAFNTAAQVRLLHTPITGTADKYAGENRCHRQ